MKKYFGTDGIRGKVGELPVTPDFVLKLGWALGEILKKHNPNKSFLTVVIGKDTRVSGYMFESVLEAGLSAAGVNTLLLGPMPTPAIAYLTRTFHAQAGIVISASHNPYYDNGIKFFDPKGTKLPDEWELEIEAQMDQAMRITDSSKLGKAKRIDDAEGRYIEFCKSTIAHEIDLSGLNIVVDCANGATYRTAPLVFKELGANVTVIANNPDGYNINEKCGSTAPQFLQKTVLEQQADVGVALDGDGDRLVMVDAKGNIIDGDQLIFIIAQHNKPQGVVGTVMSNLGMEQALQELNIDFVRTPVGDRHVIAEMQQRNWILGGESSGHIICGNVTTTGDGIIAALQVLAVMKQTQKPLLELASLMEKLPQVTINVRTNAAVNIEDNAIQKAVQQIEKQLGNTGRVLLRKSGTEPVIRVMVEGQEPGLVKHSAQQLADLIKESLNS
jgi:phosphoglucosamine mutase